MLGMACQHANHTKHTHTHKHTNPKSLRTTYKTKTCVYNSAMRNGEFSRSKNESKQQKPQSKHYKTKTYISHNAPGNSTKQFIIKCCTSLICVRIQMQNKQTKILQTNKCFLFSDWTHNFIIQSDSFCFQNASAQHKISNNKTKKKANKHPTYNISTTKYTFLKSQITQQHSSHSQIKDPTNTNESKSTTNTSCLYINLCKNKYK